MSEVGFELELDEPEAPVATSEEVSEESGNEEEKPVARKASKDPLPDGFVTPTGLTHLANDDEVVNQNILKPLTPQQMYGFVKAGKDFPSDVHSDGRVIVPQEAGLAWVRERTQMQAEKRAAKAAEAKTTEEG